METIITLVCCAIPTTYELWDDRNGEDKKDKVRDVVIAFLLYTILTLALWWVNETHPLKSLALMLGIRVMLFDYLIQYILIKRGVIHGHWFFYQGKTAKWDRVIKYLNPWVVLAVRVILFAASLLLLVLRP